MDAFAKQPGDADGNGKLDVWDVRSIERSAGTRHLRVRAPENADVSQNGVVDQGDAEAVDKVVHGISTLKITTSEHISEGVPTHELGQTIVVRVTDTFLPRNVRKGTIRIRSNAAKYDSGELNLTPDKYGNSLYYRWRTAGLARANDYRISAILYKEPAQTAPADPGSKKTVAAEASLKTVVPAVFTANKPVIQSRDEHDAAEPKRDEKTNDLESFRHEVEVALIPRESEVTLLDTSTDLSLPFWEIGLNLTRRFYHDTEANPVEGVLGFGWRHAYEIRLQENTDGSVEIRNAGVEFGPFQRISEGKYQAAAGVHAKLTRDPDGSFRLLLGTGEHWYFDSDLLVSEFIDAEGHRISFEHDEHANLLAARDESGQALFFEADDDGRLMKVKDTADRWVKYEYDSDGNLETVTRSDNAAWKYAYDSGHRLRDILHMSNTTHFEYDSRGRVREIRKSDGKVTSITYSRSPTGEVSRVLRNETGRSETQNLSNEGTVVARKFPDGAREIIGYDSELRVSQLTNGAQKWYFLLDEYNRLTRLEGAGAGCFRELEYSEKNRHPSVAKDANQIETHCRYLDSGLPTHLQFPDGTVEVRYYPRPIASNTSAAKETAAKKKSSNVVKRKLRNGQLMQYVFDARGLLVERQFPDKSRWTYSYDTLGQLKSAKNPTTEIKFVYDGNLLKQAVYPGERAFVYEHNERKQLDQVIDPDGKRLRFNYHPTGRVAGIAEEERTLVNYEDKVDSLQIRRTLLPGTQTLTSFKQGRLQKIEHSNKGKEIDSREFALAGDELVVTSGLGAATYAWNDRGFLMLASDEHGVVEKFEYDAAGNRQSQSRGGKSVAYTVNVLNQYTLINGNLRDHDLNGNLSAEQNASGKLAYEYDAENRLIRIHLPDGGVIHYAYDPLGRIAQRTVDGSTQVFLWDRDRIALVQDLQNKSTARLVWGRDNELVAIERGESRQFAVVDSQGSVEAMVDSQGDIVASVKYTAFGEPTTKGDLISPFLFRGAFFEPAVGLYLLENRWYSPQTGSYLQPDPTAEIGGNAYQLRDNNPICASTRPYQPALSFILEGKPLPGECSQLAALYPIIDSSVSAPSVCVPLFNKRANPFAFLQVQR